MLKYSALFLLQVVFFGTACQAQAPKKAYVPALIGFYNVENLFDTLDTPDVNDAEYTPNSAKLWGTERYMRKLDRLAQVIGEMGKDLDPRGLAIVGLAEVENKEVVEDLAKAAAIRDRGYKVVHVDGPDRRGIDPALMYDPSRFTLLSYKSYRLTMPSKPELLTRDQLLVSGILDGDTMHVIVTHWPSRRGGEKRSMPNRQAAGELGRHIVDSLFARDPEARILYMGDLNDDPIDKSVKQSLGSTGDKAKAIDGKLFNPMYASYQKGVGTLAWRDTWNLFDQILISGSLVSGQGGKYRYHSTHIHNKDHLIQKEGNFAGYPLRTYVGDTYQDGFSDHFAVFLTLLRDVE